MPYRFMFRRGLWVLAASVLLGACSAGRVGHGVPGHYAQSFDSATSACRQNPALCARMAGEEAVVPQAAQRLVEVGTSAAVAVLVLDATLKGHIEQALKECAEHARTQVLIQEMGGRLPTEEDCDEWVVDKQGRTVTRAMYFGQEMHKVALQCTEERLNTLRPGGYSLDQRYRYDRNTGKRELVSSEEAQALLQQWRGNELKGTIVPDVVLHSGNALWVEAVYDFKFPCAPGGEPTAWSKYPEGHPHQGRSQKELYEEVLGAKARRVLPWFGIMP